MSKNLKTTEQIIEELKKSDSESASMFLWLFALLMLTKPFNYPEPDLSIKEDVAELKGKMSVIEKLL